MIDLRPVCVIVGWLLALLGGAMLLPLLVDLLDRDPNASAFGEAAVVTIVAGAAIATASGSARQRGLSKQQGFILTTLCWIAFSAFAALPLMLGAPHLSFARAFFETVSAMTTTGATVIVGLDEAPRGLLLWRLILQWIGGLGVVLLAMILLPVLRIGGMQILRMGDFNTIDKIMPRARDLAQSFGNVYVGLTVVCALAYDWSGMSPFDAWGHAMSTIATGGMANYDASFSGFSISAQYVATLFMLLSSLSFVRYVQFLAGDAAPFFRDTQIRTFALIYLGLCAALVLARLQDGQTFGEPMLREVAFSLASVISTTGFATADYGQWGGLAAVIVFCAMMIGGCSGSTAGGPKVFRYQILATVTAAEIMSLRRPHQVRVLRYQGRRVGPDVINSVMALMMCFFLTLGIGAVALAAIGLDPVTAITGAAATLSNVGPGLGPLIGPAGNYAALPDSALWVMSGLMIVGRLELLTVFVIFTAAFWRG